MIRDMIARFFWRQFGKPSGLFGRYIGNGMARGNEYDASWTVSLLDIQPESRVLEIGFGPGVSTQFASEKASTGFVAGIDRSETMVQAARKRNISAIQAGRMELKQGDMASLSYPDESFDKAFSLHFIYFLGQSSRVHQGVEVGPKTGGVACDYHPAEGQMVSIPTTRI